MVWVFNSSFLRWGGSFLSSFDKELLQDLHISSRSLAVMCKTMMLQIARPSGCVPYRLLPSSPALHREAAAIGWARTCIIVKVTSWSSGYWGPCMGSMGGMSLICPSRPTFSTTSSGTWKALLVLKVLSMDNWWSESSIAVGLQASSCSKTQIIYS